MPPNHYFECGTCWAAFPAGWRARDNHCRSTGHRRPSLECDSCHRNFNSDRARFQHMQDTNHFEFECNICSDTWPTESQRREHEIEEHLYCPDCDRLFQSGNGIQMHLRSRVHLGTSIKCPFCKDEFVTATGLTHHLETGACPNAQGLDRDELYRFVRRKDPDSLISKKLIGWHGSDKFEATEQAWDGFGYRCYLCHRSFTKLVGLNQHLKSPVHQQALYHCPNRSCGREFTSLGALINHLESESCGFIRYESVQKGIGDLVSGNRLLR